MADLVKQLFENTHFINLEHRIDRLYHVKNELLKINITGSRFNAIKTTDGAIGCSMSHLKCIEMAKQNESPFVFICEDDIQFLDAPLFLKQIETFCENVPALPTNRRLLCSFSQLSNHHRIHCPTTLL